MRETKNLKKLILFMSFGLLMACGSDSDDGSSTIVEATLSAAFDEFDTNNVTVMLDGEEIVIETNGLPNHTSPYWSNTHSYWTTTPDGEQVFHEGADSNHELFVEPTVTSFEELAPGYIDSFNGTYTLRIPINAAKASSSSSTGLGAIGIAVSGAVIYNDEEGPGVPLDDAAGSLDYSGAHTGPQSYHYHLEPKAWSEDDDKLIGVISDGFLLYGRKCASNGTYPTDLDVSGGHASITTHSSEELYHYHIQNELYLNQYYILFPGDYQGTSNAIN